MPPVRRYFKKLKEKGLINAYRKALMEISADPSAGELKTGDLAGIYCFGITIFETKKAAPKGRLLLFF